LYPTPDKESAFLKTFAVAPVLKPYIRPRWISTIGESHSSEAGYGAVHFDKTLEAQFAMPLPDRHALMANLTQDIVGSLEASGMRILDNAGNDAQGFHLSYGDSHTSGIVTITPLRQLDEDRLGGDFGSGPKKESLRFLEPGEIPVEFTISAKETWTK
jgi:hypothetical protein